MTYFTDFSFLAPAGISREPHLTLPSEVWEQLQTQVLYTHISGAGGAVLHAADTADVIYGTCGCFYPWAVGGMAAGVPFVWFCSPCADIAVCVAAIPVLGSRETVYGVLYRLYVFLL